MPPLRRERVLRARQRGGERHGGASKRRRCSERRVSQDGRGDGSLHDSSAPPQRSRRLVAAAHGRSERSRPSPAGECEQREPRLLPRCSAGTWTGRLVSSSRASISTGRAATCPSASAASLPAAVAPRRRTDDRRQHLEVVRCDARPRAYTAAAHVRVIALEAIEGGARPLGVVPPQVSVRAAPGCVRRVEPRAAPRVEPPARRGSESESSKEDRARETGGNRL